ncbi:MAG: hypothetical protein H6581_22525 [Bacteroidia bacterium]|nr:hypothetical protein [Bacteroidia bacterium]
MEGKEKSPPRIEVDTNHYFELPSCPAISQEMVKELGLSPGQEVIAYMPPDKIDEWKGIVRYNPNLQHKWQWWVELLD